MVLSQTPTRAADHGPVCRSRTVCLFTPSIVSVVVNNILMRSLLSTTIYYAEVIWDSISSRPSVSIGELSWQLFVVTVDKVRPFIPSRKDAS